MGRRALITYEDVAAACEALVTKGVKPSANSVKELLGASSSTTTYQKFVDQWRSGHQAKPSAKKNIKPDIEDGKLETILQAFKDLDKKMNDLALYVREQREIAQTELVGAVTAAITDPLDKLSAKLAVAIRATLDPRNAPPGPAKKAKSKTLPAGVAGGGGPPLLF